MEKHTITFVKQGQSVTISSNETILDAARLLKLVIHTPCGGKGICKKCTVRLLSGSVSADCSGDKNMYLSCLAKPLSDCSVELIEMEKHQTFTAQKIPDNIQNLVTLKKTVFKQPLSLNKDFFKNDIPDKNLLLEFIKENISGKNANNAALDDGLFEKISSYLIDGNEEITITRDDSSHIIDIEPGNTEHSCYGLAIDLGTTTIDIFLVDLNMGQVLQNRSIYNLQSQFGDDVISRIIYSEKNKALHTMQDAAISSINEILSRFVQLVSVDLNNIYRVVISGNTTMTHFLTATDPSGIREKEYTPVFDKLSFIQAEKLALSINKNAQVIIFPCPANYIGGDIVAGILSNNIHKSDKLKLLVDIGTNGEVVLGNAEWLIGCSCSAGPAFEGTNISCGTRAIAGAIYSISIDPQTLNPNYKTIDDTLPAGLCGSAIIDLIASMFDAGIIDRQGKINRIPGSNRIRSAGSIMEYVIVFEDQSQTRRDITINENDIQNVIRAKAAIFAGINSLLQAVNITFDEVEKIIIAGSFGRYLNFKNAVKLGLLPDLSVDKFDFSGNSSLYGSYVLLNNHEMSSEIDFITENLTYLDLMDSQEFMDFYMAGLFVPYTDLKLFPSLLK